MSATSETPASSAPDLIARFLGRAAAAGGPYALLALTPEDRSESLVILQLQRQLARIANHPDGLTASADEVRAALHAAASEILAATRASRQLTPQSESKNPSSATPPSQMSVADSILGTPISPARDEFAPVAAAAYAILAEAGGWNRESQQRLLQLAHTAGLTPHQIITLAMNRPAVAASGSSVTSPATTASSSRPQRSPGSTDEPGAVRAEGPGDGTYIDESDPVRRFVKIGMVVGICAVITLVVGALSISALTRKTPPKPAVIAAATPEQKGDPRDKAAPVQLFPTRRIDANADKPEDKDKPKPAPTADSSAPDFTTALRSLHAAVDVLESDAPGAMQRFDAAVNTLSQTWTTVPADQLLASQDAVVEFIYRSAADPARGRATIRAIAAPLIAASGSPPPAESISPAAWSGGMIARLLRERELPAAALQEARAAFSHPLLALLSESDSTFAGGATAVLATLAHRIVPTHKTPPTAPVIPAWNAWTFAVDGVPAKDSVKNLIRIRALDAVLVEGAEVNKSKATYESIVLLASAINWRSGEESRLWLLHWVDSPDVSAPDLHALTSVLASRSAAEGLDITMVLSNTASGGDRAALRDRLREIWNLKNGPDRATLIADWERLVGNRIDADPAQFSSLQHLTNAWNLSRLNEVAAQVWLGEPTELMLPDDSTLQGLASSPTRIAPHWNGESTWVVSYVAAGASISKRKELLNSFTPYGEPIAAEAEVIVNESIRGSPAEVRKLAQTLLNRWRTLPVFVNALLETIPTMPATNENSDLLARVSYGTLPAPRDPSWRFAARRALVERLLQLISDDGELRGFDRVCQLMGESYSRRLAIVTSSDPAVPPGTADDKPPATPPKPPPPVTTPQSPDDTPDSMSDEPKVENPGLGTEEEKDGRPVETIAAFLRARWEREASSKTPSGREPFSLETLSARRLSRNRLAVGRVQQFAAEQVNICELMAFVVCAEQPGRAPKVITVLDELALRRKTAEHVAAQLEAAERALIQLWRLRLGSDQP